MFYSYDIIKPLSKEITRDYVVFSVVSNGTTILKINQKMLELYWKTKWYFFSDTV